MPADLTPADFEAMQRFVAFSATGLRWADKYAIEWDGAKWAAGTKQNDYYDGWSWWDCGEDATLAEAINAYLEIEAKNAR